MDSNKNRPSEELVEASEGRGRPSLHGVRVCLSTPPARALPLPNE